MLENVFDNRVSYTALQEHATHLIHYDQNLLY